MVSKPWRYPQSSKCSVFRAGKRRGGAPGASHCPSEPDAFPPFIPISWSIPLCQELEPGDRRSTSVKKTSRLAASNLVINGRSQFAIGLSESAGTIGILSQW
jgi:hypothetical protein